MAHFFLKKTGASTCTKTVYTKLVLTSQILTISLRLTFTKVINFVAVLIYCCARGGGGEEL